MLDLHHREAEARGEQQDQHPRNGGREAHERVVAAGPQAGGERHQGAGPERDRDGVHQHGRAHQPLRRGRARVPTGGERGADTKQCDKRQRAAPRETAPEHDHKADAQRDAGDHGRDPIGRADAGRPDRGAGQVRQRDRERIGALQADREDDRHKTEARQHDDHPANARRRGPPVNPGAEHRPADAEHQRRIDGDPGEPERGLGGAVGLRHGSRRAVARLPEREPHDAADRMAIGRDHPPAQQVAAALGHRRHADRDRIVLVADRAEQHEPPARFDQPQRDRRHRLVEGEPQRRGRIRQHRAIAGRAVDQRGVRMGVAGVRQQRGEEQRDAGDKAHDAD